MSNLRHRHSWKGGQSREYKTWQSMKERCFNRRHPKYKLYGGRGITVCSRWLVFENFLADIGAKPVGMTLERLDGNGNYEPINCEWAGYAKQNRNRRNTLWFEKDGKRMTVADWCRETGQRYGLVTLRLHYGWELERAIFTPSGRCSK